HYAISDLNKDELVKIRDFVSGYTFQGTEKISIHNARCFEDFKTYLDGFISQYEADRYMEYRHGEVSQKRQKLDQYSDVSAEELKFHFEDKMKEYFEKHPAALARNKDMKDVTLSKFRELMDNLEPSEQAGILRLILKFDTGTVIRDMYERPLGYLLEMSRTRTQE